MINSSLISLNSLWIVNESSPVWLFDNKSSSQSSDKWNTFLTSSRCHLFTKINGHHLKMTAFFLPMPIIPMDVQLEIPRIETPPIPWQAAITSVYLGTRMPGAELPASILNGEYHGELWDMNVARLILCWCPWNYYIQYGYSSTQKDRKVQCVTIFGGFLLVYVLRVAIIVICWCEIAAICRCL